MLYSCERCGKPCDVYDGCEACNATDAADAELGRMVRELVEKYGGFTVRDPGEMEIGDPRYVVNINTKRAYKEPAVADTLDEAVKKAMEAKLSEWCSPAKTPP